jgi:hypothetical protein
MKLGYPWQQGEKAADEERGIVETADLRGARPPLDE